MAKVETIGIYGLNESVVGSKFPMSVDVKRLNNTVTPTVCTLASSNNGEGHDQFLTGITVIFDLTFSNKAWVEAERYTFLNFISSQSTMHRIAKFDISSQCNEYVSDTTITEVNRLKDIYNETQEKEDYLRLLYNIPAGFELTARMITNYRALKTIYKQRRHHRLPEWHVFCDWCETLPYFKEWFVDNKEDR